MNLNTSKLNICIVAHNGYGAIHGGTFGHVGGVERQTSLLAHWLAKRDHTVSFLTWREGSPGEEIIDNVRVIKMCNQDDGIPGLRFFYPRWTSLIRSLKAADANLYYQNDAEYVTGQIALWCKLHGRRFIFSVASDKDCELNSPKVKKIQDRLFYPVGLKKAHKIIAQTKKQQLLLTKNYNVSSTVIPMPGPAPANIPQNGSLSLTKKVIWIGRIVESKRLELLLDVAEELPDIRFDIAGSPENLKDPYYMDLLTRTEKMKNVKLHGRVIRAKMGDFFKGASILCNTSLWEGFPNTFLEAWSNGIPVVSTFDPDNLIDRYKLGIYAKNKSEIISAIRSLLKKNSLWQDMSDKAKQYFENNHALDKAMIRFEKVFLKVQNGNLLTFILSLRIIATFEFAF